MNVIHEKQYVLIFSIVRVIMHDYLTGLTGRINVINSKSCINMHLAFRVMLFHSFKPVALMDVLSKLQVYYIWLAYDV